MKPTVHKTFKWFFTRIFFLYLVLFLLSLTFVDYGRVKKYIVALHLNHMIPSLRELRDIEKGENFKPQTVNFLINYYKEISENLTDKATAYSTLGILYDYQGNTKEAVKMFEKAVKEAPLFPTFVFNLGYMYHKAGRYLESNQVLLKVLNVPERLVAEYINYSFTYRQIMARNLNKDENILDILMKKRKVEASILIADNYLKLKDYKSLYNFSGVMLKSHFPESKIFYYYAGISAYFLKDFKDALKYFNMFQTKPLDANITFYTSEIFKALGHKKESQELLEAALYLRSKKMLIVEKIIKRLTLHVL